MSQIFETLGRPILFYIPESDPLRQYYLKIIEENGGIISGSKPNGVNGVVVISSSDNSGYEPSYKGQLLEDSVKKGELVDTFEYQYPIGQKQAGRKKTSRYSIEQDDYILEQMRLNPHKKGSHKFFEELATHSMLNDHTHHSIRSRYRKHLEGKLDYCYKVDETGKLQLFNGEKIKIPILEIPNQKRKFNALEDYTLCVEVMRYTLSKLTPEDWKYESTKSDDQPSRIPDNPSVPVLFFKDVMQRKHRSHTDQSWRDRYRKFAVKYGVKRYIEYYEDCLAKGETPSEMKQFTTANFKQNNLEATSLIGTSYDSRVNVPLDEEISQVKNSNVARVMRQLAKEAQASVGGVVMASPLIDIDPEVTKSDTSKLTASPLPRGKTSGDSKSPLSLKRSIPAPNLDSIDDSGSEDEESLRIKRKQPQPPTKPKKLKINKAGKQLGMKVKYVNKNTTFSDILTPEFHDVDFNDVFKKIETLCQKPDYSNGAEIFVQMQELNFKFPFTGHILKSVSEKVEEIPRFLEFWARKLAETGDPIDSLNIYHEIGVWNDDYDNSLRIERKMNKSKDNISFQPQSEKDYRAEYLQLSNLM